MNAKTYGGDVTPLHVACESEQGKSVKTLLDCNAPVDEKTKTGWTGLHFAAKCGNLRICRKLLKNGADVRALTDDGDSPLHLAAGSGSSALIKLLVDTELEILIPYMEETATDLNVSSPDSGRIGLEESPQPMSVESLTSSRRPPSTLREGQVASWNYKNAVGDTPILLAAGSGSEDGVVTLLMADVDVNLQNKKKQTALHKAVQGGYDSIVDKLIRAGADCDLTDVYMSTPLDKARQKGRTKMIRSMEATKAVKRVAMGKANMRRGSLAVAPPADVIGAGGEKIGTDNGVSTRSQTFPERPGCIGISIAAPSELSDLPESIMSISEE